MIISSDTSEKKLFQLSVITFILLAIIAGQAAFGGTIYVKPSGSGNGSSWLNAYGNLQIALNAARYDDEIWVSVGTYKPSTRVDGSDSRYQTFQMKNGVALYGGFAGTEEPSTFDLADRDFEANETILSGDLNGDDDSGGDDSENSYHVFYHPIGTNLDATAILDGFTITAGNADRSGRHGSGGGMNNYISNSPTVRNCMFIGNSAIYGGGMNNIFGSNPTVSNCAFIGNSAIYGGGMDNYRSSPTVSNCTFAGNSAFFYGGGMDNFDLSIVTVSNCIFWGNSAPYGGNEISLHFSSIIDVDYCDVEGGPAGIYDDVSGNIINWGIGNIDVDPLFVDPSGVDGVIGTEDDNLRLQAGSLCIDAGGNLFVSVATDLDGQPRIVDGDGDVDGTTVVDMGAYEHSFGFTMIYVNADGTGDYATVQAAISNSVDGDVIILQPGTYTGDGNRDIDFMGKTILVRSTDPTDSNVVAATVIDCEGTEPEPHRGFYFHNDEGANSIISGLTITNGYEQSGGGIYCSSSSPTIHNCTITDNFADNAGGGISGCDGIIRGCTITGNTVESYGGGLYGCNGEITDCVISENSASGWGGGLDSCDGQISKCEISNNAADFGGGLSYCSNISDCEIVGNNASWGGGLESCDGQISKCEISNNTADFGGGGLDYCSNISDSEIVGNNASWGGGLYYCNGEIFNCIISDNSAEYGGGLDECSASLKNCVISNNIAQQSGGGAQVEFGTRESSFSYCTIVGNIALYGGGIGVDGDYMSTSNSIIWDNQATYGPQIALLDTWDDPSSCAISYSDVQGGPEEVYVDAGCTLSWGMGNIEVDPLFVDPSSDDFHLKSEGWRWDVVGGGWIRGGETSRCIDAGNPGSPLGDELLSVPDDPNNLFGENIRINMGVYGGTSKASMPPYDWTLLGDLSNDGIVNLEVFVWYGVNWLITAEAQPGDIDRDGTVGINDLALLAKDWLEETSWALP